jgi:hypothetical protein
VSKQLKILVTQKGTLKFIHDDSLKIILDQGTALVRRASHVEPSPDGKQWSADMTPVGGDVLGPFDTKKKALAAEIKWLNNNLARI